MVLSAFLSVSVSVLGSMGVAALLRLPRARWGVFVAMAGFSNTLFIGIPVCTQLFGESCLPHVMLYYLAHTTLLQSVGIMLVERAGTAGKSQTTAAEFIKGIVLKPPILGLFAALLLLLLGLRLPAPLMRFAGYVSDSVTPLALIYCGFIVYEVGLKNLRLMPGHAVMLVMRLIVAPVICLIFCSCLLYTSVGV